MLIHNITSYFPRSDGSMVALWCDLTEEQIESSKTAVKCLINSERKSPEELHEIWMKPLADSGWTQGKYSLENKTHPSLVRYDALPDTEKIKDLIWQAMVDVFGAYYTESDEGAINLC